MDDLGGKSRISSNFSVLLSLVLSAALGLGFVALVNKGHELLSPMQTREQRALGTWQGNSQGVPAVWLRIECDGYQLHGTAVLRTIDERNPLSSDSPVTLNLDEATFDGQTLHFRLAGNRGGVDLFPSAIHMTVIGDNEAQLKLTTAGRNDEVVTVTRRA